MASYLLLRLLQQYPQVTERVYSTTISPLIGRGLSRLTGVLPFSLFEIVLVAVIGLALFRFVAGVRALMRRERRWSNALACGLLWLGQGAGIFVTLFYLLWGFNYVRPSLEQRL